MSKTALPHDYFVNKTIFKGSKYYFCITWFLGANEMVPRGQLSAEKFEWGQAKNHSMTT